MKKIFKFLIIIISCFFIVSCDSKSNKKNENIPVDDEIKEVASINSEFQHILYFNKLKKALDFKTSDSLGEFNDIKFFIPSDLIILFNNDFYVERSLFLPFNSNINLDIYNDFVEGMVLDRLDGDSVDYHYSFKVQEFNSNYISYDNLFNYNNNIIYSNYTKVYHLYYMNTYQLISFFITKDNDIHIMLYEKNNDNLDQLMYGYVVKPLPSKSSDLCLDSASIIKVSNNIYKYVGDTSFLFLSNNLKIVKICNDETKYDEFIEKNNTKVYFKGLELYAWKTNDMWEFVLLMGTNRLKSKDELVTAMKLDINDAKVLVDYYKNINVIISLSIIRSLELVKDEVSVDGFIKDDALYNELNNELGI